MSFACFYSYANSSSRSCASLEKALSSGDRKCITNFIKGKSQFKIVKESFTPLTFAVQKGHTQAVSILLGLGVDPSAPDLSGRTPLMYAAARNDVGLVEKLIKATAYTKTKDKNGRMASDYLRYKSNYLHRLLSADDPIQVLNETERERARQREGERAHLKRYDITRLKEVEAEADKARERARAEADKARERARAESASKDLRAGLYYCSSPSEVSKALQNGVDPNGLRNHWTFLTYTIEKYLGVLVDKKQCLKILEMLIQAGADVQATDKSGKRAIDYLSYSGYKSITETEVARLLYKATRKAPDIQKRLNSALMSAAKVGDRKNVIALLQIGADAKARDDKGKTFLDYLPSTKSMPPIIAP